MECVNPKCNKQTSRDRNTLCDDCGKEAQENFNNGRLICINCGSATAKAEHPFCRACHVRFVRPAMVLRRSGSSAASGGSSMTPAAPTVIPSAPAATPVVSTLPPVPSTGSGATPAAPTVHAPNAAATPTVSTPPVADLEIWLPKDKYSVKSGGKITLTAVLSRKVSDDEMKNLVFVIEGDSEADVGLHSGVFTAPVVKDDYTQKVKVKYLGSAKEETIEVVVLAAKMPVIKLDNCSVVAGKTIQLKPTWENVIGTEPKLSYEVSNDVGEVDDDGKYTAPVVMTSENAEVKVFTADKFFGQDIDTRTITIRVKPLRMIAQRHELVESGKVIQFEVSKSFEKHRIRWEIKDFRRGIGNIDPQSGKYTAPAVISKDEDIIIRALDLASGEKDEVVLPLRAIQMIETSPQSRVNAGQKKIQLNIESKMDLLGRDNFTCKVLPNSKGWPPGRAEEGGVYFPPASVDQVEIVKVEAVSKTDGSKKITIEFEVGFPLCKNCKTETDESYACPSCGQSIF